MLVRLSSRWILALIVILGFALPSLAADWPMGRHDAQRSNASPTSLPAELHLQWVRELPPLKPAWPDQPKMQFDTAYNPIVLGKTMYFGSSRTDSITALDTETGTEKWRFQADGPIRFAPVGWEGKVYFSSDDGYLYCIDGVKGSLLWKFRGGPSDRKILGNERLISTWPARGAPVLADGVVYFAASIWPFMGVFIHALDARTGQVVWTNDGDGSTYMKQPHSADSFAGVAPQGPMVVVGDHLLIPGGRSVPALYDRKTGKMVRYQLNENSKKGGGSQVSAIGNYFFNGNAVFETTSEKFLKAFPEPVVLTDEVIYNFAAGACVAHDLKKAVLETSETKDKKGEPVKVTKWNLTEMGSTPIPAPRIESMIKAGSRLYVGVLNHVLAVDVPLSAKKEVTWKATTEGTPVNLLAAADRLFVVTREGRIYCFGAGQVKSQTHPLTLSPAPPADEWTTKAEKILEDTGMREGYAIVWGAGSGRLVTELARQSNLRLIVLEPEEKKVAALRQQLVEAGLYGDRVAVHRGEPLTFSLPPYLANLMVSEDLATSGIEPKVSCLKNVFQSLRPYGGVACLPTALNTRKDFAQLVTDAGLSNAKVKESAAGLLLVRDGALPGSANWTHEHADSSNTRVSRDQIVKAPLGVLWFGGPSHEGILPRHGHGPQPQVIDGRLIIEGVDMLRAMDIYTGRVLWEAKLPGVGAFYNNLAHQPGANSSGTNYISTSDGIYVVYGRSCLRLDLATGKTIAKYQLPMMNGAKTAPVWGYINVHENYLIGGADPIFDSKLAAMVTKGGDDDPPDKKPEDKKPEESEGGLLSGLLSKIKKADNDNLSSSRRLVIMDRHSGKVLWTADARSLFRHNAVCVGGDRLYCIDRYSSAELARMKRRGEEPTHKPRLVVFDLRTGKEIWSTENDVFGTWLSYSSEHDILMEAGRVARDTVLDEPKGMRAYRAGDGKVQWTNKNFSGPAMLHHGTILMAGSACNLLTGAPKMRKDPITGQPIEWTWVRNYGCNTPAASEHLLTFRSGAAGFFDYCNDGGTGNFGGFRSSCTNNLIVAGGLLNAPDYTRTCTCSYQNQTSLALIHMPEAELWTFFGAGDAKHPVKRVGINLGAPGDRRAADGTLWLEYPVTAGKSPVVTVTTVPANPEWFRRHESQVQGEGLNWVAASGAKGLQSLTIDLGKATNAMTTYTVRLSFLEPDRVKPGKRVFNVEVQGKQVLKDFDMVKEAGGPNRALVKEFKGVKAGKELRIALTATTGETVLCGVEVVAEK